MPRLIDKSQHLGAPKRIVGLVVPPARVQRRRRLPVPRLRLAYIAQAFGIDLSLGEQIALLAVFLITSKGSAVVAGRLHHPCGDAFDHRHRPSWRSC